MCTKGLNCGKNATSMGFTLRLLALGPFDPVADTLVATVIINMADEISNM